MAEWQCARGPPAREAGLSGGVVQKGGMAGGLAPLGKGLGVGKPVRSFLQPPGRACLRTVHRVGSQLRVALAPFVPWTRHPHPVPVPIAGSGVHLKVPSRKLKSAPPPGPCPQPYFQSCLCINECPVSRPAGTLRPGRPATSLSVVRVTL